MLRITEGGFYSSVYEDMKREICELISEGKEVKVIVPEQQTVSTEREFSLLLPPSSALILEITNFTRLANSVYRTLGGISAEYSDKARESLIMWRTLTELSPFLTVMNYSEISSGVVAKALAAVNEMKSIAASPEELARLSESERMDANARLKSKLSDISKIMSLYEKLLGERYNSSSDECARLAEKLSEHPDFFRGTHCYITGFTSFTEPQHSVITELIKRCDVTVHLTLPKAERDFFEYTEIRKCEASLIRCADRASCEKRLIRQDRKRVDAPIALSEICNLLWRNFGEIDNDSLQNIENSLKIYEAADPYEECDFIASDIKRRVIEGEKFRDFAIVARSADAYGGIIDASLEAAGVPYFFSRRRDIQSYEAVKLIFAAFAIVSGGFKRGDVISYAKCALSGISRDACDEFELYSETWQIDGTRFSDGIYWNMSPDGYTNRKSPERDALIININATRKAITEPLISFGEDLREAKTVREHASALVKFMTDIELEARIEASRLELLSLGESAAADEASRLFEIICDSLDTLVEVLGDCEIDTAGFENQLRVVLGEADIGRIPAFFDEVTVGSADMLRLSEKKHVYLLGVNQGEFPRAAKSGSYFTDKEGSLLSELGLSLDDGIDTAYARELFVFSRAFSAAGRSVVICSSARGDSLGETERSEVIGRIAKLTENRCKPKKISELSPLERIYSPETALDYIASAEIRRVLTDIGHTRNTEVALGDISLNDPKLSEDTASLIYGGDIALTQSRIDTYFKCPFSYYLQYNIKLREERTASFDARNIGSFIHAIFENFFADARERGDISAITREEREEMVEAAAEKYLSCIELDTERESRRTGLLIKRLSRAALPIVEDLCTELENSAFVPRFFELEMENGSDTLPRPAAFDIGDGKSAYVYGSIDRVDTFKSGEDVYVRVIDYKTGKKSFSPEDLTEGKNLQMFLYLKAVTDTESQSFKDAVGLGEGGRLIPAGVIYIKPDLGDAKILHDSPEEEKAEVEKKLTRSGMILNDPASIAAMNPRYTPVAFKKNGEPYARSEKFLYTEDGWKELSKTVGDKVKEAAKGMKEGNISLSKKAPDAKDSPCGYCKYRSICRRQ